MIWLVQDFLHSISCTLINHIVCVVLTLYLNGRCTQKICNKIIISPSESLLWASYIQGTTQLMCACLRVYNVMWTWPYLIVVMWLCTPSSETLGAKESTVARCMAVWLPIALHGCVVHMREKESREVCTNDTLINMLMCKSDWQLLYSIFPKNSSIARHSRRVWFE